MGRAARSGSPTAPRADASAAVLVPSVRGGACERRLRLGGRWSARVADRRRGRAQGGTTRPLRNVGVVARDRAVARCTTRSRGPLDRRACAGLCTSSLPGRTSTCRGAPRRRNEPAAAVATTPWRSARARAPRRRSAGSGRRRGCRPPWPRAAGPRCGRSPAPSSSACGSGRPAAGWSATGTSPPSTWRFLAAASRGSATGTARHQRARVGHAAGGRRAGRRSASSTILPRYMTATRSHMWRTTDEVVGDEDRASARARAAGRAAG